MKLFSKFNMANKLPAERKGKSFKINTGQILDEFFVDRGDRSMHDPAFFRNVGKVNYNTRIRRVRTKKK